MNMPIAESAAEPRVLVFKDGRKFTYFDNDVDSNRALILHHGTPSTGELWTPFMEAAAERGVRAVAYTRAGYFGSDRSPGRTIVGYSDDIRELLDALGISEFVSVGWSGGGPHALQTTFFSECKGADLMAGVGPYQEMGESFRIGLPESETAELHDALARSFEASLQLTQRDVEEVKKIWTLENFNNNDLAREKYEEYKERYARFNELLVPALWNGMIYDQIGCAEDNHAIMSNWGFKVRDVKKPVSIWNGTLDKACTPKMAEYQHSQIAGSSLHILEGQTHGSIMVEYMEVILDSAIEKLNV